MATINGYTAERMQEIEDAIIVEAEVVGDNLMLTRHDSTVINAGNVRGEPGIPGLTEMELYDPVGIPKPLIISTIPDGYGVCDAQTEYDADDFPILALAFGTGGACINGASSVGMFRLPDLRGRLLVGLHSGITAFDTLHKIGGSKDAVTVSHGHNHNHGGEVNEDGTNHNHGTGTAGDHDHSPGVDGNVWVVSIGGVQSQRIPDSGSTTNGVYITFTSNDTTGSHNHGATDGASGWVHTHGIEMDSTSVGVSGTDANLSPYRVIRWIMRLA